MSRKIKITIVGDTSNWNHPDFSKIKSSTADQIKKSDLFIFNLEGPIYSKKVKQEFTPYNFFTFLIAKLFNKLQPIVFSDENLPLQIPVGKINVACLANNHIKDRGLIGFRNTLKVLKKNGFLYVGAGSNIADAKKILKLNINNKKIAIINSNYIGWNFRGLFINIFGAGKDSFGANYLKWSELNEEINILKKDGFYVIAVLHCGQEMKPMSENLKSKLSEISADATVVHHQHYLEEINVKNTYTTGDFIFKARHLPKKRSSKLLEFNL